MAITRLTEKPGLAAQFGTGLGRGISSGISSGLQQLAQEKVNQLKNRMEQKKKQQEQADMFQALIDSNIDPVRAASITRMPTSGLSTELMRTLRFLDKKGMSQPGQEPQFGQEAPPIQVEEPGQSLGQAPQGQKKADIFKLRKQALKHSKTGGKGQEAFKNKLLMSGITPDEQQIVLGKELNDSAIRYFLSKTNNNPKKARQLAKKFGYKV